VTALAISVGAIGGADEAIANVESAAGNLDVVRELVVRDWARGGW
jgi:hypothetical protein